MLDNRKVIIDEECCLSNSAETLAASSAGSVDGVAKTFDTGGGYTNGMFVVDVSAITGMATAGSCHTIEVCLEGSTTSTFTTYVRLASFKFGQKAAAFAHSRLGQDSTYATASATRYMKPFHNDFQGTIFRWLRCYTVFGGTVNEADIKFKAYISK
jgi:hypothetical protein